MLKRKKGTDSFEGLMPNASPSTPVTPSDNFSFKPAGKGNALSAEKHGDGEKSSVQGEKGDVMDVTNVADVTDAMDVKAATRLAEKSEQGNHHFPMEDVKGLVGALNRPWAVFNYGNNAKNVIKHLSYGGKQFFVGIHLNQQHNGSEVSTVRGLFPKDNAEWLNWRALGKATYLDHKKIQALIDKQRINLADVEYLNLESVAKVMLCRRLYKGTGKSSVQGEKGGRLRMLRRLLI